MAAKISTLFDDFNLAALDRSKWDLNGATILRFIPKTGLQMASPSAQWTTAGIISHSTYDFTDGRVWAEVDGINTGSTAGSFTMFRDANQAERYGFAWYVANGVKTIKAYYASTTGVQTVLWTAPWSPTAHKYVRFQHSSTADMVYFQTGSNGVAWVQRAKTPAFTPTLMRVAITVGSVSGGWLNVRRVNTLKAINRGPGFVSDKFLYPLMSIPTYVIGSIAGSATPQQYGQWALKSGTAFVKQSPLTPVTIGNNLLNLGSGTIVSAVPSGLTPVDGVWKSATIQDINFQVDVYTEGAATHKLIWRADPTESNYWYLKITPTTAVVGTYSGGADHDLSPSITFPTTLSIPVGQPALITWKVIAVKSEVVVLSNVQPDPTLGIRVNTLKEVLRINPTSSLLQQNGTIGFISNGSVSYRNVSVTNGSFVPAASIPVDPADRTQVKPWVGTKLAPGSNFDYLYLIDDFGNTLNLIPTYGDVMVNDVDLGSPVARAVIRQKPLLSGARSYTRFHGEKSVSMTLTAIKTQYQEAQYYSDLIQRWAAPGHRSKLIYKPKGAAERYIDIEGTSLGRVAITAVAAQKITMDVAWIAVDGGDYVTVPQTQTIVGGYSGVIVNSGGLDTEPVIRIIGPSTNPVLYNQTIEDYYPDRSARLGLTYTLDATEFVDLDCRNRTVQYMGQPDDSASLREFLTTRDWFVLQSLRNQILYTSDDTSGSCVITWRDKY